MFRQIYNLLEHIDHNKKVYLEQGRKLTLMKTLAEASGANRLTIRAIDLELQNVREALATLSYIKDTTPVKYVVVSVVEGGQC